MLHKCYAEWLTLSSKQWNMKISKQWSVEWLLPANFYFTYDGSNSGSLKILKEQFQSI